MTGGRIDPPAQVSGFGPGSGVVAITVGRTHTCAIKSDQSALCWGDNPLGALGDGTTTDRSVPTLVATLGAGSGTTQIAAGDGYTCAARNNGAATCRGTDGSGQLGNGPRTASLGPVCAPGLGTGAVAAGTYLAHGCARAGGGAVFCRGGNANGQLGDGTRDLAVAPQPVAFGDSIFRDGLE